MVAAGRTHAAHFYEDPAVLADRVAGYLGHAFSDGGGAIAVARAETIAACDERLARHGFDLASLRAANRYLTLDADVLSHELVPGPLPDAPRFVATVRDVLARVRSV